MNVDGDCDKLYLAIKQHYERDTIASKHALRQLMMTQKLSGNEDISGYISRINTYSQQLKGMSDVISDQDLLFSLFYGLPQDYSALVSTLRIQADLTYAKAVQHLKDHYEILKLHNNDEDSAGFAGDRKQNQGQNNRSGKYCTFHKSTTHDTKDCRMVNENAVANGNSSDKAYANSYSANANQPYCLIHKSNGHWTKDCFKVQICSSCGKQGHSADKCYQNVKGISGGSDKANKYHLNNENNGDDSALYAYSTATISR